MKYLDEIKSFKLCGAPVSAEPYGEGHINETLLVVTDTGAKYILQRVNDRIFKDVPALMNNIRLVTGHIAEKIRAAGGDVMRETLNLVPAADGGAFLRTENGFFRVYVFIDGATSHQTVTDPSQFYQSAAAFGTFQNYLADFDASQLAETIPDFHDTEKRFEAFQNAVKADKAGRAAAVQREIDFVLSRQKYCARITALLRSGQMPLRVTHNDTKLNNVMLDDETGRALAVIDLDTVMPGSSCYDFGDSIRFGCNSAAEDERDLGKVYFRADLFKTYADGYLGALKNITPIEKENLAFGALLMTYECGTRFLTDHLDGDNYFRIHRPGHNLDRARTQFKLVADMEGAMGEMEKIIANA